MIKYLSFFFLICYLTINYFCLGLYAGRATRLTSASQIKKVFGHDSKFRIGKSVPGYTLACLLLTTQKQVYRQCVLISSLRVKQKQLWFLLIAVFSIEQLNNKFLNIFQLFGEIKKMLLYNFNQQQPQAKRNFFFLK